jgi:hypothetical protein
LTASLAIATAKSIVFYDDVEVGDSKCNIGDSKSAVADRKILLTDHDRRIRET